MTSSPPPTDDSPEPVETAPEATEASEEPPLHEPNPWPDPTPTEAAAETGPGATGTGRQADAGQMSAIAQDLIDRGAPWDSRTSWTIVLVEAVVAAVVGLLFIFKPLGGSSTTLQIVGLILLAGSLITTFQLWRQNLRPEIEQLASFRSGSGVTVGLLVIVATFFVPVTDAVVAALSVAVGVGFFVFGITGIAGSFVRMQHDAPLPLATLVANAVLALAGLVLIFAGARGADSVDGIFNLLGVLLIAAGLALGGYAYILRQQAEGR
jgi:uncharacterized membrane protein HdeD (DUF308 family)